MLFRFSALTFNPHRIHYDHGYATREEGYPGLVVHGPLTAMLLVDLARNNVPEATLRKFAFRAQRPLFAKTPFAVCGDRKNGMLRLWAESPDDQIAMDAVAEIGEMIC
jgi:3-methylfumaryl-CoA hydratase